MSRLTEIESTRLTELVDARREAIRHAPDTVTFPGTAYYAAADGDDANPGTSPDCPWKTLGKVSAASLLPGDAVLFRRGDVFRGTVRTKPGVTYAAYGSGEKPAFYGGDFSLADPDLWELIDADHAIWQVKVPMMDAGALVFNHGEAHTRKLIPSYLGGRFVCRNDPTTPFELAEQMTEDLDLFCRVDNRLSPPEQGPVIPLVGDGSVGTLYLRCDRGNPGTVFDAIEALPGRSLFRIGSDPDVHLDNLCLKYVGAHAIAAGGHSVRGLRVTNCEIGWIGGTVQHYYGTDPNDPSSARGRVTRFGNGVEIYGGCENYEVSHSYFYEIYDAAITHQMTTGDSGTEMKHVRYRDNLVENCVYSIEYFLEFGGSDRSGMMRDVEMQGNYLLNAGFGWGRQRPNPETPAHIKGWNHNNPAEQFVIRENLFWRSTHRLLHTVADDTASCPALFSNVYIQDKGGMLGQWGGKESGIPATLRFDEDAASILADRYGETNPTAYVICDT